MSDPPKPAPTFSFATPATSGGSSSSGLFGLASSNNNSSSNIFGSGAAKNPSSSGGLFGSTSNTSTTPSSNIFGSTTTTSASTQPSTFGLASNTAPPLGNTSSNLNPFGGGKNSSSSGAFSGFSTPSKPSDASNSVPSQTPGVFGNASTGGSGLFGNPGSNATSSSQAGSTTPATSKPGGGFSFGNVSTTPAGPPPSGVAGAGSGLGSGFNFNKSQEQNPKTFWNVGGAQSSVSQQTPATTASSNPFGGVANSSASGLFGTSKPSDTSATSTAPSSAGLFGSTGNTSSSNIFGANKPTNQQSGSLFGNLNNAQSNAGQQQGNGQQSSSFFPNVETPKSATAPTTRSSGFSMPGALGSNASSASSKPTCIFPAPTSAQPPGATNTSNTTSGSATPGLFGNLGAQTTSMAVPTTAPTALTQEPSPAFNSPDNGKAPVKNVQTTDSSIPGIAATSSAPAESFTLFAGAQKQSDKKKASQSTTEPPTNTTADDASKSTTNLGASTSGPRPPAQSRLKNKSMDEIITRWASDLSKYQKEFQKQAQRVATWDRMLVENSDKIQKLYGSTLEAERATVEVERQLSAVENDQAELEYWLEHYERQVDEMMATQVGQGDSLYGPDQERERTYKLAEKLSERLDEMGKDLSSMIEEINDASSNLSKTSKSDDPLSQIVRVLNNHLSQLQQIDQGAAALQAKVTAAQRASRGIGSNASLTGHGSDAADDFYRSYMGRR